MKKFLVLFNLVFTLFLFSIAYQVYDSAYAAHGTFGKDFANGGGEGRRWVSVVITGAGTGNGTGTITGTDLTYVKNRYIQEILTTPGTGAAAPSAYTGQMSDAWGRSITIPTRSTTAVESLDVPSTMGRNWSVLTDLTITLTGIGEGNTVTVRILVH